MLHVAVAQPGAVESELLAVLDDVQGVLDAGRGVGGVEGSDGQEAEAAQREGGVGAHKSMIDVCG